MTFAAVFLGSLLGSLHCAGMCGGFVLFFSEKAQGRIAPHIAYHLGRLLTYAALGAAAGSLGNALNFVGENFGLSGLAGLLTGIFLMIWASAELLGVRTFISKPESSSGFSSGFSSGPVFQALLGLYRRCFSEDSNLSLSARTFLLGCLSTFLPCGWLYSFLVVAAGSGTAWLGSLVMLAFWIGTLPVLLGISAVASRLSQRARYLMPKATSLILLFAGFFAILSHLAPHLLPQVPFLNHSDSCH